MGLISTEVEVKIGNNISYYENLGYEIPRRINKQGKLTTPVGTKILVKVKDLSIGASVYVSVKCDNPNCTNPIENLVVWQNYLRYKKEDNTYYCRKCGWNSDSTDKFVKTKLLRGKSFHMWCIENKRQDILDRWDYELNKSSPKTILYSTNQLYYFKCPKGIHDSELKHIDAFVNGQEGSISCNQCISFAQININTIGKDFLEKYWDYELNKNINPWRIKANCHNKIWIKCQNKKYHESYIINCDLFTRGNRCSYCSGKKLHILDSLGSLCPITLNLWSNKNKKLPFEYFQGSNKDIWWKCSDGKHEDYKRNIYNSNRFEFRCPECTQERIESILQGKVRLHLESFNYTILHEHNCTILPRNPKTEGTTNNILPFDNEIKELKLLCEVNGIQHYEICGIHTLSSKHSDRTPEEEFKYQQYKDQYKKDFAILEGYSYLEIPYTSDDANETYKQLINDKILQLNTLPIQEAI